MSGRSHSQPPVVPARRRPLPALPAETLPARGGAPQEYADYADTIDLHEVVAVVRRHAVMIAVAGVLVAAAAAALVASQPAEYEAGAILRLKDVRSAIAGGIGGDASALQGLVMGRTTDPLLSELEILKSPAVAQEVVDREGLRLEVGREIPARLVRAVSVAPEVAPDTLELRFSAAGVQASGRAGRSAAAYGQPVQLGGVSFTIDRTPEVDEARLVVVSHERAMESYLENLSARAREQTDVVDVAYTANDPEVARRVVNATVTIFQELNTRVAQQQSRRRRTFVEEQLASTDSMLAEAQLALSNFRRREQVYSSGQKFAAEQSALMGLDVRREELDAERRMYESLLAGVQKAEGKGSSDGLRALIASPGLAQNPMVAQLFGRLMQYQMSFDSMTTGKFASSAENPDVRKLATLAAGTREELLGAARSHVESIRARIDALDELKARTATEMQALPAAEAEEVRLVLQVETVKKIADQLREEYQKARVAEVVEAGQVEVLTLASVPDEPVPDFGGVKIGFGLVAGLLFGGLGAFLRERMNTSIGRKDELETLLQVPALGIIPQIMPSSGRSALLGMMRREGAEQDDSNRLLSGGQLTTTGAEAYRVLRTNLIFSQAIQSLRTVVVTSSNSSEGKTTTSSNLAVAFAQQGMRVLLVDCDLRRPRLHKVFQVGTEPGLTQLVFGMAEPAEAIRPTPVDGLFVLPAGTLPPNPSELLGSERMRETLDDIGAAFDVVILDTPPVLAASDAAVLAARADGVLVVVRAGHTDRGAALYTMQQLEAVGARVVGTVLNDPDAKVPRRHGYYGYQNYAYTH